MVSLPSVVSWWIKRPVDDFWVTICKLIHPMLSDCCLSLCLSCNVGVLRPNSWMDQDATWCGGRPPPRPHCVTWGPSSLLPMERGTAAAPPLFSPCLLWPNGWMDQDATWYGGRPQPRPHCVSSPMENGTYSPTLQPMSVVAKQSPISAAVELLFLVTLSGLSSLSDLTSCKEPAPVVSKNSLFGISLSDLRKGLLNKNLRCLCVLICVGDNAHTTILREYTAESRPI